MAKKYAEGDNTPYTELQVQEDHLPPKLSRLRTILLNFTQYGLNFMVLLLSVVVVPAQVEKMSGGTHKGRTMGGMVAGGAAVTFLLSPLIGMVSDRTTLRLGRRRPLMIIGTFFLCSGLLGMALSAPHINEYNPEKDQANISGRLETSYSNNETIGDIILMKNMEADKELHCDVDLVERRCWPFQENLSHVEPPPRRSHDFGNVAGHAQGVVLPKDLDSSGAEIKTSGNLALYVVFFLLVISSQAMVAVPFNALVADKSHPTQRGFNSGVMGAMILLGNVSGAIAGTAFTRLGVLPMFGIIIAVLVISITISLLSVTEAVPKLDDGIEPVSCKLIFVGFWKPLKEHDFRWVFITRFLMQQGVATITGFLEYWLNDMVPLPNCWSAATSVALLLLPLLFAAAISSVVFGIVSDNTGYRKIIVALAAFTMALGAFINAFLTGKYAYYIAGLMAFIIGLGFGAYQSVDFALVMDVLPEESDKAKDIAVWHQALVLPQALATPLGGLILDLFEKVNCRIGLGYIILFLVTTVYFILSGLFVFRIRRPR
ncbi:uncharacterized protein LOC106073789 [Biomphalaria glabrata]|uniref:Uncharacterized protein LOC106073789 n=1 Tax=Biomphalaria glabrata TaxID=6526 RepID=A0A9W2ZJ86_BIOGL|nr:uncharacterized protein LOC106073789 [Biomphalaria glabrata]XP_055875026.1 uncharacterized protein LOC106073789 [Biomphalaria glabrata]XP_055875027.1 uncharacterized protein LOC106073789 [Biomphalaria glabrata]XP_055875028.1 uncharacterized protein LOC106073789 [Biomphalaria glabrata]XP_055875030.1 uncharacterized protein LOC106073789 [Biomphalaria glabrata]XP_055875031.1 uncharacterized protein LOC106073789 [Biomphalaria glabrata]